MNASQVKLEESNSNFSLYYTRYPYSGGLNIKRAASGFSIWNFVLNQKDVYDLEKWFTLQNITGIYKYTKAKTWVRCQNEISKRQMIALTKWLRKNKKTIAFWIK